MVASIMPPTATTLEKALDAAYGGRLDALPVPIADVWDPWKCPAQLLPWLAYASGLRWWSDAWPEAVKRAEIADAWASAGSAGTLAAVERVLDAAGAIYTITENSSGAHTLSILVRNISGIASSLADLRDAIAVAMRLSVAWTLATPADMIADIRVGAAAGAVNQVGFALEIDA